MSKQRLEGFIALIISDVALQDEIAAAGQMKPSAFAALGAGRGFEFTEAELLELFPEFGQRGSALPPVLPTSARAPGESYSPEQIAAFVSGRITLGELEGISKASQYEMAKIGFELLTQGKLDGAREVFEGLRVLDPRDAYFYAALGSIAQRAQDLDGAEALYSRALELDPGAAYVQANRGEVRLAKERWEAAFADLLAVVERDPQGDHVWSHRPRTLLAAMKHQLEQADAQGGVPPTPNLPAD